MTELMSSGIELMLVGMGIVYLFLALLVIVINMMSYVIQRFFPEEPPAVKIGSNGLDKNTVAAITAAVHHYRSRK